MKKLTFQDSTNRNIEFYAFLLITIITYYYNNFTGIMHEIYDNVMWKN